MEKIDFTAGNEKKFFDFIGKLGSERVALVSHTDLDGIICAKVVNRVVDVNVMKFVGYQALDKNLVQELKNEKVKKVIFTDISVENILFLREIEKFADVLIGAVLIKGEKTPHLVTESMVKEMKKGAVIVDVSIDQGGCIETSRITTLSDPVFSYKDVIHYCVPNMPALVSRTASYGLNNAAIEYIQNIAEHGLANALLADAGLSKGVCTYKASCTNEAIANIFNVEYRKLRIFSTN